MRRVAVPAGATDVRRADHAAELRSRAGPSGRLCMPSTFGRNHSRSMDGDLEDPVRHPTGPLEPPGELSGMGPPRAFALVYSRRGKPRLLDR
jgi:hypothetical protein